MPRLPRILASLLLFGCTATKGDDDDAQDTGTPGGDTGPVVAEPLRVGTFNADWLWSYYGGDPMPRNATDFRMVGRLLSDHDLHLVGMQEVDGSGAIQLLELPDAYAWTTGNSGWNQNPAIVWRDDLLSVENVREVQLPSHDGANKMPLVADVRSRQGDLAFTFVVVHLTPYVDDEYARERAQQVLELQAWLAEEVKAEGEPPFSENILIVGDFNDTFEGINRDIDTLQPLEDDPDYVFATSFTNHYTQIPFESQIDHLVLSTGLMERWVNAESREGVTVIPHEQIEPWSSYEGGWDDPYQTISDHRPVWISLEAAE